MVRSGSFARRERQGGNATATAAANGLPAAARHVTPDGTTRNNKPSTVSGARPQTIHNSPDANSRFFPIRRLGDGPRSTPRRSKRTSRAVSPARDTAAIADAAPRGPARSLDNCATPANATNAGPPPGRPHCNTGSTREPDETKPRTLSANTAEPADSTRRGLAPNPIAEHAEGGPREVRSRRSSLGVEAKTPLRGVFVLIPASSHRRCPSLQLNPRPDQTRPLHAANHFTPTHRDPPLAVSPPPTAKMAAYFAATDTTSPIGLN
jgi:hypothetical protein